jgi:hypothetical protein
MTRERLGEVTVPSGVLTILDAGHIGMFEADELEQVPAIAIGDLPRDRALPVWGTRVGKGPWARCWDHVTIEIGGAPAVASEEVGEAIVDHARLLLADESNADKWVHSGCIDGKADFVFWGRDAEALAAAVGAPALGDGEFGWRDLDVDEVVRLGTEVEERKDAGAWKAATDFRPHSHHWQALEAARGAPTDSATITVEDLRVCLFFTTWGDGEFPVIVDVDADGRPVEIRIQLRTAESEAAMAEVNEA